MKKLVIVLFVALLITDSASGQVADTSTLFQQLHKMDSLLFEDGFNKCDFSSYDRIIHKDLEFLHDVGGPQDRTKFFEAVKKNICGNLEMKPIRKLINNTHKVFPLFNDGKLYAAIQMGDHEFFVSEKGKPLRLTGAARFIHTWLLVNDQWQLKTVLSYDHRSKE
jgi:hypothetical protein